MARTLAQIFAGQNSYEQKMEDIHICARLSVESTHLNDEGIGWAANTMELARKRISDLEKLALPIVRKENERIRGSLRFQGYHNLNEFNMFEWLEEYVYLLAFLDDKDIDCGQLKSQAN